MIIFLNFIYRVKKIMSLKFILWFFKEDLLLMDENKNYIRLYKIWFNYKFGKNLYKNVKILFFFNF